MGGGVGILKEGIILKLSILVYLIVEGYGIIYVVI